MLGVMVFKKTDLLSGAAVANPYTEQTFTEYLLISTANRGYLQLITDRPAETVWLPHPVSQTLMNSTSALNIKKRFFQNG